MNPIKSGMWKSTKFVQWAVVSIVSIIIFLLVFIPKYLAYLGAIEMLVPGQDLYSEYLNLFITLSDRIDAVWIILLGAMGAGTVGYGIFNQIQKFSPTEKIKAQSRHGGGPSPKEEKKEVDYSGFTGIRMDRSYMKDRTLSDAWVYKDGQNIWKFVTLELPWNNNAYQDSCVPPGRYPVVKEHSPKFGEILPELKDVPNRSECKFHVANYPSELLGCIAPGLSFGDLDEDGLLDVASSRKALDKIMSLTPGSFEVIINGDV